MKYITRIAPSPTGDMHIGNVRTAYFNWLAARASGGMFILRIDDTDKTRSEAKYTDVILETMDWLGLDYDKLVYQSHRFHVYRSYANLLKSQGWAEDKDGAIVLSLKESKLPTEWHDEVIGTVQITPDNVRTTDKMVLIKSDGSPSYNFATVVDDLNMGVNFIIRGNDHTTNTARQVILFNLLAPDDGENYLPKFAHIGMIAVKNKPLSKREGESSILAYKQKGIHPEAMLNFLSRLGWSPTKDDKTTAVLPRAKMLELFLTGGKMRTSQANMDLMKLDSFDRKYKAMKEVTVL